MFASKPTYTFIFSNFHFYGVIAVKECPAGHSQPLPTWQ
jgi:hypothetical protein